MKHCFECGNPLVGVIQEGRERLRCEACGWTYYPQLKVSTAAVIEKEDCILLARRANAPWLGYWYLPAGYVEADENPEDAVSREVREETGLIVLPSQLIGLYFFDDDPRGHGLLLVYRCQVVGGQVTTSDETDAVRYFSTEDLPHKICGAGHQDALRDWVSRKESRGG